MLVELKAKAQVTIPKDIVNKLNLSQGDQFEITEVNGKIILTPVVIYPQHIINDLKATVQEMKTQYVKGEIPLFEDGDALIDELDK